MLLNSAINTGKIGMRNRNMHKPYNQQSQVENEHYSTLSGLIQFQSLECFIEITPDFVCPFMTMQSNFRAIATGNLYLNLCNSPYANVLPVTAMIQPLQ